MIYEEELAALLQKAMDEESRAIHAVACAGSFMEMVKLEKELNKLKRKHDKEFCELRAKYHLPPPKVVDSISQKSENDNNEKKY